MVNKLRSVLLNVACNSNFYPLFLINEAHEVARRIISSIIRETLKAKQDREVALRLDDLLSSRYEYEYGLVCAYCYLTYALISLSCDSAFTVLMNCHSYGEEGDALNLNYAF